MKYTVTLSVTELGDFRSLAFDEDKKTAHAMEAPSLETVLLGMASDISQRELKKRFGTNPDQPDSHGQP